MGFYGAKAKNATKAGQGDLSTYTAICADSKLSVSWLVGSRSAETRRLFMDDVADCLAERVQLTTDGLGFYVASVESASGYKGADIAQLPKRYGTPGGVPGRYGTQSVCIVADQPAIMGKPVMDNMSTSYVESANLTMRMGMRRFTHLTNGFSKFPENHAHAATLHFMFHNFCRVQTTLTQNAKGVKTNSAVACGLTDRVSTVEKTLEHDGPRLGVTIRTGHCPREFHACCGG